MFELHRSNPVPTKCTPEELATYMEREGECIDPIQFKGEYYGYAARVTSAEGQGVLLYIPDIDLDDVMQPKKPGKKEKK